MKLRSMLISASILLCGVVHAATPSPIDAVKLVNFLCTYSYQSSAWDPQFSKMVKEAGGTFVLAPLSSDSAYGVKDRIYYATKRIRPELAIDVSNSMFRAIHENEIDLVGEAETMELLKGVYPDAALWERVLSEKDSPETERSISKAYRLAVQVGDLVFPTYVFLKDGAVIYSMSPFAGQNMFEYKKQVFDKYTELVAAEAKRVAEINAKGKR